MNDCHVCFLLINVVSLQTPADSQLVDSTITTRGLALPRPGAQPVSLPRRVWFHLPKLPLLPNWLCAAEGKDSPSVGKREKLGGDSQRRLALGSPRCSPVFPMPLKRAVSCWSGWSVASRQV